MLDSMINAYFWCVLCYFFRVYFALFVYLMNFNGLITLFFAYKLLKLDGFNFLIFMGVPAMLIFGSPALVVVFFLVSDIKQFENYLLEQLRNSLPKARQIDFLGWYCYTASTFLIT